jgi:hypothetical protein
VAPRVVHAKAPHQRLRHAQAQLAGKLRIERDELVVRCLTPRAEAELITRAGPAERATESRFESRPCWGACRSRSADERAHRCFLAQERRLEAELRIERAIGCGHAVGRLLAGDPNHRDVGVVLQRLRQRIGQRERSLP